MGTGLLRRGLAQALQRPAAERPARGGEQDPAHADLPQAARIVARHALEDGVVLAVDRQQLCPMGLHRLHEQGPGHHQGFLVGQQHALARLHRRQGRLEAGSADDGRHHRIHLGMRRHFAQALLADQHFNVQTGSQQTALQLPRGVGTRHHGITRSMQQAQAFQLDQPTVASQGEHRVVVRMTSDYIKGGQTDGAGRTQYGYLLLHRLPQPCSQSSTANIGTAAVRLSMRSSTPP
ncbi:hypothetical protein D3C78_1181940 [compost metagenome]